MLEITTQILLIYVVSIGTVLLVYKIFLLIYLAFLVTVALIFGTKLLKSMGEQSRSRLVLTDLAERIVASRRNLSRLVFATCVLLALGVVITSITLVPNWGSTPQKVFAIDFVNFSFSVASVLTIMLTFRQLRHVVNCVVVYASVLSY